MFAADYPFRVDHDILVSLAADKCPGLAGRPKLVFVQVRERRGERGDLAGMLSVLSAGVSRSGHGPGQQCEG